MKKLFFLGTILLSLAALLVPPSYGQKKEAKIYVLDSPAGAGYYEANLAIDSLFAKAADGAGQQDEATRAVFGALVHSTLKYRDHLRETKGIKLTVSDVQQTLDWLIPCLATGKLPKTTNEIRLSLLKIWLAELKPSGKPSSQPAMPPT